MYSFEAEDDDVVSESTSAIEAQVQASKPNDEEKTETVKASKSTKSANTNSQESITTTTANAQDSSGASSATATTKAAEKDTKSSSSTTTVPTTAARTTAAPTTAAHEHTWTEITQVVHHDPVYTTVTIPEQGHWQENTVTVLVEEEWDEFVGEYHNFCRTCGLDLTAAGLTSNNGGITNHMKENEHFLGYYGNVVPVLVAHHDPVYGTQVERTWVVESPAHTEQQLVSAAYDETVVTGYRCSVCGATK